MKKLLIVSAVFPPEPVVSATLSADLAKKLNENKKVTILSPKPSRPLGFSFEKQKTATSYEHVILKSFICPESKILGRFKESIGFGRAVSHYIKMHSTEIEIIYANTWPLMAQFLTVREAKKNNIPIFIHVQDIYPESLTTKVPILGKIVNWLLLPIDKYTLLNATYVIAISERMKNYLVKTRELDGEKVHVIPNWQNEEDFIRFRQSKQINKSCNAFTFMYLGNIGPVAGIDLLINAFGKANLPNSRLVIAGSGSQKETLQKKCSEQQLVNIEFWDVPEGKVPEIQDQANVMLLPIKKGAASSSIPSKLPAYMFSAKPIIACVDEGSDTAEAIKKSDCGWVLEPDNTEELAKLMIEVYNTNKDFLENKGQQGFEYAIANFSKKENLQKIIKVITKVASDAN